MKRLVRRALVVAALLNGHGCAHVEPPPGGPEDDIPPTVVTTTPEREAIAPGYSGPVVLEFDERISQNRIAEAITVSPRTSPVEVRHGRSSIRVSLREGWAPGVIYHIGVSRDVQDLFNNRLAEPVRFVFSTGPEIPDTRVSGTVVDRITGRPASDLRIEAIRSDSLVYAAASDSVGAFVIQQFPPGEYKLRAFRDLDRNRALDPFEPRDSAVAAIPAGEELTIELRLLEPDSTAPVPGAAVLEGEIVTIEFDDFLDPEQTLETGQVTIRSGTGAAVAIDTVAIGELATLQPDTTAAGTPPAVDQPGQPAPPAPAPPAAAAPSAVALPSQTISIRLAAQQELLPGQEYTVEVIGIRNLVGLVGGGEASFEVAEEPPDQPALP